MVNRSVPGSRVTAPYGTIEDTGRVQLSSEVIMKLTDEIEINKDLKSPRQEDKKNAYEKNVPRI